LALTNSCREKPQNFKDKQEKDNALPKGGALAYLVCRVTLRFPLDGWLIAPLIFLIPYTMTTEKILAFCKVYNFEPLSAKSEFEFLPRLLGDHEQLTSLVEGIIYGNYRDIAGKGLLISTDQRIIFFRKSFIGKDTFEEVLLSNITSVIFDEGPTYGSIIISADGRTLMIEQCNKIYGVKAVRIMMELVTST